jgi:hypothetical protein
MIVVNLSSYAAQIDDDHAADCVWEFTGPCGCLLVLQQAAAVSQTV